MKFPSILRTAKHQKFKIVPRYYDPVKEDIDQRTARIKNQVLADGKNEDSNYSPRLTGSFSRRHSYQSNAGILQFGIMIILATAIFGYLEFGNKVLYGLLLIAPVYLYLKRKKNA